MKKQGKGKTCEGRVREFCKFLNECGYVAWQNHTGSGRDTGEPFDFSIVGETTTFVECKECHGKRFYLNAPKTLQEISNLVKVHHYGNRAFMVVAWMKTGVVRVVDIMDVKDSAYLTQEDGELWDEWVKTFKLDTGS